MIKDANDLRDEIISKVRIGELTPGEAEAEAEAAGLPPFANQPAFADFNPMVQSRWSIVMTVAWIAWRDLQVVAEQQPAYRSQCTHWVPHDWNQPTDGGKRFEIRTGWFLEPWHPSTTLQLQLADKLSGAEWKAPGPAGLGPHEAEVSLWEALSEGRLRAEGFNRASGLVEIPVGEWTHLKLFGDLEQDILKYDSLDYDQPYTKVRLQRDDVLRLWPPQGGVAKSERECRRWLVGLIRESPNERLKPKRQFKIEAQKKFKNLSERQFLRAWDAAVEEVPGNKWSNPGRRKTKSNHRTS